MRLATMTKASAETLDYDVLFHKWLRQDDRLISVTPSLSTGSSLVIKRVDLADKSLKFWLEGGQENQEATVSFLAQTFKGRTKQGAFTVRIKNCNC